MTVLDCVGLSCPIPVVKTKKALKEHPEGLEVLVDNVAAKENVSRFGKTMGYTVSVSDEAEGVWRVGMSK